MSKKTTMIGSNPDNNVNYVAPEELQKWIRTDLTAYVGNLEGQWLTIVDATFSDPQQRKAMKDIVRKMIWYWDVDIIRMMCPNSTTTVHPDGRVVPDPR